MKNKIILMMIVGHLAFAAIVNAQTVGISASTGFSPLSTLDVNGTLGVTITGGLVSGSTTTYTTVAPTTSTVLFNNNISPSAISLPNPTLFLNRVYIITNASVVTSATAWSVAGNTTPAAAGFYYNLSRVSTNAVPINTGIMIISDGTNWVQIR